MSNISPLLTAWLSSNDSLSSRELQLTAKERDPGNGKEESGVFIRACYLMSSGTPVV